MTFWAHLCNEDCTTADMVFKVDILPTCDFFEGQVSCTSLTLSVSMAAPINYRMWVLEVIGAAALFKQAWINGTIATN